MRQRWLLVTRLAKELTRRKVLPVGRVLTLVRPVTVWSPDFHSAGFYAAGQAVLAARRFHELVALGEDNVKLKSWAVTTLPALQHHLDMAQGLDK